MFETLLFIAAVIVLILLVVLLQNTIVPKLIKLSGFICAGISLFLPSYSVSIMGQVFEINVVNCITGTTLEYGFENSVPIKSNLFYISLFVIVIVGLIITLIKDSKSINIATAILSLIGIFIVCLMLFKQVEIGTIIKISANIGIALMFASFLVVLAISIIKIYSFITPVENTEKYDNDVDNEN